MCSAGEQRQTAGKSTAWGTNAGSLCHRRRLLPVMLLLNSYNGWPAANGKEQGANHELAT
jgi:hypothetical protein